MVGRRRGGKTISGNGRTGLDFAKSRWAAENRDQWRNLVVKSSVVPQ